MMTYFLRTIATLVIGAVGWVVLGFLATAPLGAIYGWSGHPAIPAAPMVVYVILYLIVLPVVCFCGAWKLVASIEARIRTCAASNSQ